MPAQQNQSSIGRISHWLRNRMRALLVPKLGSGEETDRLAQDVGLSPGEFRVLNRQNPHAADLLLDRMAALDLDPGEVREIAPASLRDLERVCSVCLSRGHCARDLARDPANPGWKDYCPNAASLGLLDKMPWASRREW
jgi:hypothetical protein